MQLTPKHYEVPYEWSHVVCNCTDEESQQQVKQGKRYKQTESGHSINPCGKLPRYLFLNCSVCNRKFVRAFLHKNYCISFVTCWECSEHAAEPFCKYHYNGYDHFHCDTVTIPPEEKYLTKRQPVKAEDIKLEEFSFDF